jgi:hypothetical protein
MKWLVYAFYPNLGIPVRVLDFNSKREMLDYVCGLRMTDTPYAIQDVSHRDKPVMIELEFSSEVGRSEMAQMLKEWAERKEE